MAKMKERAIEAGFEGRQSTSHPQPRIGTSMRVQAPQQAPTQDAGYQQPTSLAYLIRGEGDREQMPRSREEFEERANRNAGFLQQPEVMAALAQFAVNIMQPVGYGGFAGALGSAIGGGLEAAGRVSTANAEEADAERKADLEEREMLVREGTLGVAEQKLEAEIGAGRRVTRERVIDASDPLNTQLGLGLKKGERARIEETIDADTGETIAANVKAPFGDQPSGPKTDVGEGVMLSEDGTSIIELKGGKAERERLAAEAAEAAKATDANLLKEEALFNIDRALTTLTTPVEVLGVELPPDAVLAGIGGLSRYVPGSPAADLAEQLGSISARLGFQELQRMRDNSKTGGAVGNVSNFEQRLLQSAFQSLSQNQSAAQLRQNLQRVKMLFTDIVDVGTLKEINDQMTAGEITPVEAEQMANTLFGVPQGQDTAPVVDPMQPEADVTNPPVDVDDETKSLWPYMTEEWKRSIIRGDTTPEVKGD